MDAPDPALSDQPFPEDDAMSDSTTIRDDVAAQLAAAGGDLARAIPALTDGARRGALTEDERRSLEEALRGGEAEPAPELVKLADFANLDEPAPVLWRDPAPDELKERERSPDAVLSEGEVAVFSSAGGLGKSTITGSLAFVAADLACAAAEATDNFGSACGLRVRRGPVVIVSYEDSPVRMAHRLMRMSDDEPPRIPDTIHVWPTPSPLFEADPDKRGAAQPWPQWGALFERVRAIKPSLFLLDPVSAALTDLSGNESGPVRAFMRKLAAEAERGKFGVLIVAHNTKAARNEAARGEDPGAGAVAGSATWYDAARGVLHMTRDPNGGDDLLVECIKSNYGRSGWGVRLGERLDPNGNLRGFECIQRLDRNGLAEARKERKGEPSGEAPAGGEDALNDMELPV